MTRGKRRYLIALIEGRICPECNQPRIELGFTNSLPASGMCWPCERAAFSEWMWNS